MKDLETINCEQLMTTPLRPIEFCVDRMISEGLFVLAGAPKIGKSWLSLDLCLSVAKGERFLENGTRKGTVLYLCLEDSYIRIQNRLFDLTDEPTANLHFAVMSGTIGGGLEIQIENFKNTYSDLRIIVIDTLQKVRDASDSTYGSDYKDLSELKRLAERLGIAIVLVHHTRKANDADPFNMISGTAAISGCVDGSFVLQKPKRDSCEAKLYCTGRDIESREMNLEFKNHRWCVTDEIEPTKHDTFSFEIHDLMIEKKHFFGTPTELCELMRKKYGGEYYPNRMKRDIVQHGVELRSYGVTFENKRSHGKRLLTLDYNRSGDTSDGRILCVEVTAFDGTPSPQSLSDTATDGGDGNFSGDTVESEVIEI